MLFNERYIQLFPIYQTSNNSHAAQYISNEYKSLFHSVNQPCNQQDSLWYYWSIYSPYLVLFPMSLVIKAQMT